MADKKIDDRKPYITIETDATGIDWNTHGSDNLQDNLTQREWKALEALFVKHPTLFRITAPYRDPELKEEMAKNKAASKASQSQRK